jgi:antitoxin (DNA-binding transcriptional repressor) of toxin-antitoxin stability system
MDRVAEKHETYVITKRGKPVARLVPVDPPKPRSVFGCMADQMEIVSDLEKPVWTDEQWRQFESERVAQGKAWDLEWRTYGTISGKKTVGQPKHLVKAGKARRQGARRAGR